VFVSTAVQEGFLTIVASVASGTVMLSLSTQGLDRLPEPVHRTLLVLVAVVVPAMLALVALRKRMVVWRTHVSPGVRAIATLASMPDFPRALAAILLYVCNFVVIAIALWLLARAMGLPASVDFG